MAHVPGTVSTRELLGHLDDLLRPSVIKDYSPNGLQVEGKGEISRIVCAVTATRNVIDAAVAQGADALIVHHGYFWKGEDPRITGMKRERLARLLKAGINLIGYHLPLDVHPELGNNVQLGLQLGWPVQGWGGEVVGGQGIIGWHVLDTPIDSATLAARVGERLQREPLLVGDLSRPLKKIAWCTGGAQDFLQDAIDLGADAFISGEISERTTHLAREAGVVYVSAGHHATERGGIIALGQHRPARRVRGRPESRLKKPAGCKKSRRGGRRGACTAGPAWKTGQRDDHRPAWKGGCARAGGPAPPVPSRGQTA